MAGEGEGKCSREEDGMRTYLGSILRTFLPRCTNDQQAKQEEIRRKEGHNNNKKIKYPDAQKNIYPKRRGQKRRYKQRYTSRPLESPFSILLFTLRS